MIFLLGGRGLVGSAFARVCEATGTAYTIIDRENYASLAGQSCALFVNANGNSRKPLAVREPLTDFDANVRVTRQTLVDFRFDRYIHLSSCDVYPDCSTPAVTAEEQVLDPAAQSPYGFHKGLGEACVRHAARDWLIFRLGGFVGPGLKKNAIFDILNGGPLWLDPASALQFLHTDAAARIMLDLARRSPGREIYNLCGAGVVSLEQVMADAGREVPVNPGSPVVQYEVSIEKISRLVTVPPTRQTVAAFVAGYTK